MHIVRHTLLVRLFLCALLAALLGAVLIALLSQFPARHLVDVGGYDAAYVQGFYDSERVDDPGDSALYLVGSDGAARWSRPASSALLFPQVGLPGSLHLRLRGWRSTGAPPYVTILLNGTEVLSAFQASGDWEEYHLSLHSGLLKASDFFVEIRAEPALTLDDGRTVGVLLDRADYTVAGLPATPYPSQVVYGALVGVMIWTLALGGWGIWPRRLPPASSSSSPAFSFQPSASSTWRSLLAGLLCYGVLWLLLYHNPPPLYPYPLRALPLAVCLGLAGLLALRYGVAIIARVPALLGVLAPTGIISLWTVATLQAAQGHLTLARPGVENDFRVFATRETLAQVCSADGFYNLGYPLLLWLVRPLYAGNAFLAGRLLACLCGTAFLIGGYWLARTLLPPAPALLALIGLALSGFVAQYGLYVGSDMPFAACVSLCLAAFVAGSQAAEASARKPVLLLLAGVFGGAAFLMRHLGLVLLPWGLLVLLMAGWHRHAWPTGIRQTLIFAAGFLIVAAPQIVINTVQAGNPLYNQQAKNIWLAVYGGTDWGRWDEAPNSVSLADVVLRDPIRFLANWWRNIVGYLGSGAEDTSEFGRVEQLRLLGWPANWLAIGG
ncbi:MAG: hypothetical protein HGA19_09840, partial [Oscillochloris sp.]|nr:hypothetical protein [Oscillochloris sp.]